MEQRMLAWVLAVFALNIAAILLFAARAGSPSDVRRILDVFLVAGMGGATVFIALRVLFYFPFRTLDLLAIVILTSLGMKTTVEALQTLSRLGLLRLADDSSNAAEIIEACTISASVLFAGAALGLRHCHVLRTDHAIARAVLIWSGMLALPAAAGVAAFPVVLIREMLKKNPDLNSAIRLAVYWFAAIGVTLINAAAIIKTLSLKTEIRAQEKEWKR